MVNQLSYTFAITISLYIKNTRNKQGLIKTKFVPEWDEKCHFGYRDLNQLTSVIQKIAVAPKAIHVNKYHLK